MSGETNSTGDYAAGVVGRVTSASPGSNTSGVWGINEETSGGTGAGVRGEHKGFGYGVYGKAVGDGDGVYGTAGAGGYAGYFANGTKGLRIPTTTSDPSYSAAAGTMVFNTSNSKLFINQDGATTWKYIQGN